MIKTLNENNFSKKRKKKSQKKARNPHFEICPLYIKYTLYKNIPTKKKKNKKFKITLDRGKKK